MDEPEQHTPAARPAEPGPAGLDEDLVVPAGTVVVLCAGSAIERRLLQEWADARVRTPDGAVPRHVDIDHPDFAPLVDPGTDDPDDPLLVPVRVLWPSGGQWGGRLPIGVATLVRPRHRAALRVVATSLPEARVLVGPPSRASLARAWVGTRPGGTAAELARNQALLSLERQQRQVHGDRYKVPRRVTEEITSRPRFARLVDRLSRELDRPRPEVLAEARAALDEMVASESPVAVDVWHRIGEFVARAYDIHVDSEPLAALRTRNRDASLVFLPNHRSYMDPLVLRSVLASQGWPPNRVLGGNNLSFWPLGAIARRSGLVFIRRSFRGAPVYKAMLREYLGYLVERRFNLEWYLEGGRTRTGKLRAPRLGLLHYLVEALEDVPADTDVLLVPSAVVYDSQTEIVAIAAEERGAEKKPEGIRWMLGYLASRTPGRSRVHVRFGEPISLREALAAVRGDASGTGPTGPDGDEDEPGGSTDVARVAYEVSDRINAVTPVTPTALVTLALLAARGRALTAAEVRGVLEPLVDQVVARGLPTTARPPRADSPETLRALRDLARSGVVTEYAGGTEPVYSITADRHLEAAFYRNTLVHFFVTRSLVEMALLAALHGVPAGDGAAAEGAEDLSDPMVRAAVDHALRLRRLLRFEFFFPRRRTFVGRVLDELRLLGLDPAGPADQERLLQVLGRARPLFAPLVLQPFLEAYAVLADRLAARPVTEPVRERELLAECSRVARQRVLQMYLRSPEANSRELFRSGLRLAEHRGLLGPAAPAAGGDGGADPEPLARGRAELAAELARDVERLRLLDRAAAASTPEEAVAVLRAGRG